MLIAADQGAIITVNGGETWSSWYNQPTAQFYHVSTDNAFPYRVCGGQQESGSACVSSRGNDGAITFRDWTPVGVEEYGYVAPDPLDPDIVYGGKRHALRPARPARCSRSVRCRSAGPITAWCARAPSSSRPSIPTRSTSRRTWSGRPSNGGESWTPISPDLTRRTGWSPPSVGKYIGTPAAAPSRRGVVYTLAPSYRDVNRDLGRHR